MTMYLPNEDIRPTGDEAGEFLDLPIHAEVAPPSPPRPEARDETARESEP